eukprot:359793-Chlamydomonas_euryale.AAC.14
MARPRTIARLAKVATWAPVACWTRSYAPSSVRSGDEQSHGRTRIAVWKCIWCPTGKRDLNVHSPITEHNGRHIAPSFCRVEAPTANLGGCSGGSKLCDVALIMTSEVEDAIREGGLAAIKVERIKAILLSLMAEVGSCSLEHLRSCSEAEVKEQLTRFKGVGPKTVACVQLFCLGRQEFPVDTHVLHICKRLGWLPSAMPREAAYEHLNSVVPGNLKFQLHVLMVQHGKVCSACMKVVRKTKGQSGPCPLTPLCSKAKAAPSPSGSKMLQSKPGKSSANLALCPGDAGRSSFVKMEADALQQPAVKHEVKEEQIGAVAAEAVKRRRKA